MTIAFASIVIRHERRVRLLFTDSVAGGAFSTALYKITSVNGDGAPVGVQAVIAPLSQPNGVELQLDTDLTPGAVYEFQANGVPGAGGGSTPTPSRQTGVFGTAPFSPVNHEGDASELDVLLYGRDVLWRGGDFVEAGGDLATIAGPANVWEALWRLGLSDGLPWDEAHGLHPREYVDGTAGAFVTIQGRALAQFLRDDRVASAEASIDFASDEEAGTLTITPTLIGDSGRAALPALTYALKQ